MKCKIYKFKSTRKDGSESIRFEIHYILKTAREMFVYEEATHFHTEYNSDFESYQWDNFKDTLTASNHYQFNLDNSVKGVISVSGFSDKPNIKIEQVREIQKWVDKKCEEINQNLI